MNLKKSWVNFPLLKNILKQNTLLAKISLIAVLAFSIIGFLGDGASNISAIFFSMSAIILTTCSAGNVQKYMTNKTAANCMASLPIDSFVLWFTHYLAGLLLVIVPLWLESMLISILEVSYIGATPVNYFIYFQLTTIFLAIIYYTISFFVSCIAGNRVGQFLYTIVFYALPSLIYIVIVWGGEALTFASFTMQGEDLLYLCMPFASGMEFISEGVWNYGIWHSLFTIGFFMASYYVFKNRSIENTGEAILYKSMNVIFRAVVVAIVSLFIFIVLSKVVAIIPDCRTSTIVLGGGIFVVLGCLIALVTEIVFKNNHIYKSMLYYIPIFIFSYLGCYAYGNFAYQDIKQEILANDEVALYAYGYSNDDMQMYEGDFANFKSKDLEKVLQQIENHPEKVYKSNGLVDERKYISLEVRLLDDWQKGLQYFTIQVETAYFNEIRDKSKALFANTIDPNMISEIEKNSQEYWYLCETLGGFSGERGVDATKNVIAILTKQDVSKLTDYLQSEEYAKNTTIFTKKLALAVQGKVYTIKLNNAFISQLIEDKSIAKRTNIMNACVGALETKFEDIVAGNPELGKMDIANYVVDTPNLVNDYHIINDTTMQLAVTYDIEDASAKKRISVPCVITFAVDGDDVKVIHVEGGQ